jgi:hypothetical protein
MRRWVVEINRAANPDPALDGRYQEVARRRQVLSRGGGLILEVECDEAAADELRGQPWVVSISPA